MLRRLVSLLRGSVRVRAEGAFPERVLNVCAARGIAFSDPVLLGETALALSLRARDWRRFQSACADARAEAHIERIAGAPFALRRLRRRRALAVGLALCVALFALDSCFIWDIRVEGDTDVPTEKILRVLADNGVRRGTFAFSIHQRSLRSHALLDLPELSWLTVNVRGCRAHVIVRRRVPKPEIINESAPTNVVASRDALVTEVRALDGEAKVLPGTTVRKGQLLISGVVETQGVEQPVVGTRYLAGKGEVYGRTWYELSTRLPLYTRKKTPTGEAKHVYAVSWGENRVKFRLKEYGNLPGKYDKIVSRKQWTLPGGLVLPVTWTTETYLPYEAARAERTRQETEALGREALLRRLRETVGAEGEVVSEHVSSAVQGDWLLVTLSAECREQIGRTVPIGLE